jgi:hypothetical protein
VRWDAPAKASIEGQGRNGFYQSRGIWERAPNSIHPEVLVNLTGITTRGLAARGHVSIYGPKALNEVAAKLADIARDPKDPNATTALLTFAREVLDMLVDKPPGKHSEVRSLARKASLRIREPWFRNSYTCSECNTNWDDEYSAPCDDDCPSCGKTMTPENSDDLTTYTEP